MLPRKQLRILEYLMRHRGEVVSQEQLLDYMWNLDINSFTNTVRVQINHLRRVLGDSADRPRYLETLSRLGYRLDDLRWRERHVTEKLSLGSYPDARLSGDHDNGRDTMRRMPRLLIVDGAADICQLLMVHYAGRGYGVRVAYDGNSALALARRELPDLLLWILACPILTGLRSAEG